MNHRDTPEVASCRLPMCLFYEERIHMKRFLTLVVAFLFVHAIQAKQEPVDYVNAFIGTTNFGTCNPGAVCPNGLMSVVPLM